jgi:hypothetical protein
MESMGLSLSGLGQKKFSSLPATGADAPKGVKPTGPKKPGTESPLDLLGSQYNLNSTTLSGTILSGVDKKVTDTMQGMKL